MPKIRLRKTRSPKKKQSKKKGKPSKTNKAKQEAEDAVSLYEDQRHILDAMRSDFMDEYPEADVALDEIKHQEDTVSGTISAAKTKIGIAKISIGGFSCARSYAQAGYDDNKLTETILSMKSPGPLLGNLIKAGVIKTIKVDKAASATFAATNPKCAKQLSDAWEDRKELTPKVTVPKL